MTQIAKHSPGPYELISGGRIVAGNKTLAEVRNISTDEGKAQAKLFIAAPDMAEALMAVITHCEGKTNKACLLAVHRARAALAKAGFK